jgi:hypothetical protein
VMFIIMKFIVVITTVLCLLWPVQYVFAFTLSLQTTHQHHSNNNILARRSTEEWFVQYLNLSTYHQKKIYSRWPGAVDSIEKLGRQRLHKWFRFFLSSEVGMEHNQLRKLILDRPQLLSYKLSNIQATTSYFLDELGLTSYEYTKLLNAYPSVLMYSIDNRLRPIVEFLQNECGRGETTSWRKILYKYPHIFSHSIEKRLLPKAKFLCNGNNLGLNRSELSQVAALFPPLLWVSEENTQSKLDFLSESLDLSTKELRTIVVTYPQVLGLSLENLKQKTEFFLDDASSNDTTFNCGLSKRQLKEFVLYQPALLAYSLENRIKPRISRMLAKNIYL